MSGGRFCNLLALRKGWSSMIENLTLHTLRSAKHKQTTKKSLQKFLKSSTITRGIRYAFQKKVERQLLGILEDVLRRKQRNHPLPSHTFYKGYLPIMSKVN